MADTPPTGETANQGDSQTNATPPAAPVANADTAEVERLKKEADQSRMAESNARNELAKLKAEQEAAKQKQLEDNEEWKQLAEKSQAELKELKDTQDAAARRAELSKATDEVFKDYPKEVVELAKTAGLGLSDDSEAAQTTLKEKLDAFKAKIAPGSQESSSSNPSSSAPVETGQSGGLGRPRSLGVDTGQVTLNPEANKQKVHEYLSELQSIKQMKLDSGHFKEA